MRRRALLAISAVIALIAAMLVISPAQAVSESLFGSATPANTSDSDTAAVTLGTTVTANVAGKITGIRFYKGSGNTGTHVGAVYTADGSLSVRGNFAGESASGWQTWTPASAIQVSAGAKFTAAVYMPKGHYAVTNAYSWPQSSASLTGTSGTYTYGTGIHFPTSVYQTSSYFVDVVFTPDVQPSPTPTATPSQTITPSPTPTDTPTATPTDPPTTASPSPSPTTTDVKGWQLTAQNVGLAPLGLSCDTLPVYTGPDKPATGAVINGQLITSGLDLSNGGITIEKSCIRPTSVGQGMPVLTTTDNNGDYLPGDDMVTIRDSDIDGTKLDLQTAAYATGFIGVGTLQRNYVHHFGSGLAIFHAGTKLDALVEGNYVTDMIGYGNPATTGNHSDAFTIRDFTDAQNPARKVVVRGNRFDCDSDNATGAFFIQAYGGRIDNVTADSNLLEGQGWLMGLEAKDNGYSNVAVTNNRWNVGGYGTAYVTGGSGFTAWSDNYRYDAAQPDGKGAVVGKP